MNLNGDISAERAAELLRELVRRPSINPAFPGGTGERAVGEYVYQFFQNFGIQSFTQEVEGERFNVLGVYEGQNPERAIILEAHMDTVQTVGMTVNPFAGTTSGNRIYGRGACDTKASLTAMMLVFETMKRNGWLPPVSVHLAATVDEEVTYKGIAHIAREVEQGRLQYEAGIVGEPTQLQIVIAHKGCVRFHVDVEGVACHSSQPQNGINAIEQMMTVLEYLRDEMAPSYALRVHPLVGPATHCVSVIEGGVASNTVPAACRITIDRRTIPGEEGMDVWRDIKWKLEGLQERHENLRITVTEPFILDYSMEVSPNSPIVHRLSNAVDSVIGSGSATVLGVPYCTDASKLTRVGVPTVVFGPGNIEQAHTKDEWIDIHQVVQAAEILLSTVMNYR